MKNLLAMLLFMIITNSQAQSNEEIMAKRKAKADSIKAANEEIIAKRKARVDSIKAVYAPFKSNAHFKFSRTFYFNGKSAITELEKTDVKVVVVRNQNETTKILFYFSDKPTVYILFKENAERALISENGNIYYSYILQPEKGNSVTLTVYENINCGIRLVNEIGSFELYYYDPNKVSCDAEIIQIK